MEMVKEQDSKVAVVHWCFTEGGNFISDAFFCERLRTKLQDEQQVSWLAESHNLSRCARDGEPHVRVPPFDSLSLSCVIISVFRINTSANLLLVFMHR